jgi:hypothetical protein
MHGGAVFAQAVAVVEEVSALAPRLGILGALVALYVGQGKQPQVGAGGARGAGARRHGRMTP